MCLCHKSTSLPNKTLPQAKSFTTHQFSSACIDMIYRYQKLFWQSLPNQYVLISNEIQLALLYLVHFMKLIMQPTTVFFFFVNIFSCCKGTDSGNYKELLSMRKKIHFRVHGLELRSWRKLCSVCRVNSIYKVLKNNFFGTYSFCLRKDGRNLEWNVIKFSVCIN